MMSWSTESIKPNAPATCCLNGRSRILQMMDHLASLTWKVYVQTINSSLTALFGRHHHLQQRIVKRVLHIQLTTVHDRSSWTERIPAARYGPMSDSDTIVSLPPWNSPTKVRVHALCGGCRYVSESTPSARLLRPFHRGKRHRSPYHLSAAVGIHSLNRENNS
jgi:hypothetical protein